MWTSRSYRALAPLCRVPEHRVNGWRCQFSRRLRSESSRPTDLEPCVAYVSRPPQAAALLTGILSISRRGSIRMARKCFKARCSRENRMTTMRRLCSTLLLAGSIAGFASLAHALTVNESFAGASTGPGWTLDGSAALTGTGAPDPIGSGWLRLTPASGGQGYAYYSQVLPISERITVSFDFADWGGTGADGLHVLPVQRGGRIHHGQRWRRIRLREHADGRAGRRNCRRVSEQLYQRHVERHCGARPWTGHSFHQRNVRALSYARDAGTRTHAGDPNYRRVTITLNPAGAGSMAVSVRLKTARRNRSNVKTSTFVSGVARERSLRAVGFHGWPDEQSRGSQLLARHGHAHHPDAFPMECRDPCRDVAARVAGCAVAAPPRIQRSLAAFDRFATPSAAPSVAPSMASVTRARVNRSRS